MSGTRGKEVTDERELAVLLGRHFRHCHLVTVTYFTTSNDPKTPHLLCATLNLLLPLAEDRTFSLWIFASTRSYLFSERKKKIPKCPGRSERLSLCVLRSFLAVPPSFC